MYISPFSFENTSNRLLQTPDFNPSWAQTFVAISVISKWAKFFPSFYTLLEHAPHWILNRYAPGAILTLDHNNVLPSFLYAFILILSPRQFPANKYPLRKFAPKSAKSFLATSSQSTSQSMASHAPYFIISSPLLCRIAKKSFLT